MFQSKVNYNFSNSPKVALTLSQTVQATDKKPLGRGATGAPPPAPPPVRNRVNENLLSDLAKKLICIPSRSI